MTIHDLITELLKWPSDGQVEVARHIAHVPGSEPAYPIVGVSGFAGSRIDGRDSGITLDIPPHAYRDEADTKEEAALLVVWRQLSAARRDSLLNLMREAVRGLKGR